MLLEIMRTGAAWDMCKAYWAGRAEDCNYALCGEGNGGLTHTIWTCKALHKQRCEVDKELAECMGEETLPKALLYRIAPAMAADDRETFWGGECDQRWSQKTKKLFGVVKKPVEDKLKDIFKKIGREATARELVQCYTGAEDKEQLPLPKPCEEVASEQIDAYCDGSVKQPRGDYWKIGG